MKSFMDEDNVPSGSVGLFNNVEGKWQHLNVKIQSGKVILN
ncbi:hypothetical protein VAE122_2930009 [Vibrio aestuarianus]|nr:hypothetical protein VAE122_2930009 [Vibrio aestuarianus]